MCTIVPISLSIGANRIVPTVSIPHPLGNPELRPEEEKQLRRELVDKGPVCLVYRRGTGRRCFKPMCPAVCGDRKEGLA